MYNGDLKMCTFVLLHYFVAKLTEEEKMRLFFTIQDLSGNRWMHTSLKIRTLILNTVSELTKIIKFSLTCNTHL